jgi:CYTH domain-containing protein
MALEIERRYLVNVEIWKKLLKPPGLLVRQGYVCNQPEKTVRVRMIGQNAWIAIKGASSNGGRIRSEFEYTIPADDARDIFVSIPMHKIAKLRFEIVYHGKQWVVDEFLDENEGLIIAEIELKDANDTVELPPWTDIEVTGDRKYYNAFLSMNPFLSWKS